MAAALILEFDGVTEAQYDAVNDKLGIDTKGGTGDFPDGMVAHTASLRDGHFVVHEVWETEDQQADFMEDRLGPALGEVGVPEPTRIVWLDVIADHRP